ncbi:MCE family protein [Actinocorallia populi]|uniref:MCE family protein n=1 Tax=Actinocorallia populi TaxID=2079200 RepID=UPI000D08E085|nr:MCE family protein [Actinocorallia populi]
MILKRGVKIQLLVFAIITVLGVTYTAVRYIGVGGSLFDRTYTAYVELPDSGGAFTNSEVTYRGVTVGRVGPIKLVPGGVRIEMEIEKGARIPRDTLAVVANRSAVGEQYIDLQPRSDDGPFLDEGRAHTIPAANTRIPVKTSDLLINVDKTVASVDTEDLRTIVDELDKAFNGSGSDLQSIIDDSGKIIREMDENFETTRDLLDNSKIVLNTQKDKGSSIRNFARELAALTDTIRENDGNIRETIDATVPATEQVDKLVDGLSDDLPVLLANLSTTGQVLTANQDSLRSLLIALPFTVAGSQTILPGDGYQHMGLALNIDSPAPCTEGYENTKPRWPQDTKEIPARTDIGCTAPKNSQTAVRGARNAPESRPFMKLPPGALDGAGEPPAASTRQTGTDAEEQSRPVYQTNSTKSVFVTGYDPTSGKYVGPDGVTYTIGSSGGTKSLLGDESWKWLLLGPLS